jgi:uncharacterized protein (TIGR00299 family) protein
VEQPDHVHLDLLGGMAGDMFVSAVLDAWPQLETVVADTVRECGLPAGWHVIHSRRLTASLDARTFDVRRPEPHHRDAEHPPAEHPLADRSHADRTHADHSHGDHSHGDHSHGAPSQSGHHHDHDHDHGHHADDSGRYGDIVQRIDKMTVPEGARHHAQGIYRKLAECEAAVHGIAIEDVHFHELADWDSVVDIVCAGALIDALGSPQFSVGTIPMGSGMVRTAHGPLPVPAPATARLLKGFEVRDDGIAGERVTPTGAAILAWLKPSSGRAGLRAILGESGMGAGQRELAGCANVLRIQGLYFGQSASAAHGRSHDDLPDGLTRDTVSILSLDVDDQTPEDIAATAECLLETPGVLDVVTLTGTGKKGRVVVELRVLCQPTLADDVALVCLAQSTSLGVRIQSAERLVLPRQMVRVELAEGPVDVKLAVRPDGTRTAKAEHDQIKTLATDQSARRDIARRAEQQALNAGPEAAIREPNDAGSARTMQESEEQ